MPPVLCATSRARAGSAEAGDDSTDVSPEVLKGRERELLDRIAERDLEAFWVLWQMHSDYLFGVGVRLCRGNRDEARDVLGDACVRLADEMPRHAPAIRDSRRWLTRIVINTAVNRFRSYRRHIVAIGALDELALVAASGRLAEPPTPEDEAVHRQFLHRTLAAMALLPRRLRVTAALRFLLDRSYDEIAGDLGISVALVRKRIQETRDILKDMALGG